MTPREKMGLLIFILGVNGFFATLEYRDIWAGVVVFITVFAGIYLFLLDAQEVK